MEVHQAHKRVVEYQIIEVDSEGASERQLQVLVELGVRISSDAPDGVDAPIHVQIEAEFVVVYEVLDDIDETSISQFANFNAVHNVWTFWRQHVFDIVQRGRLHQIEVQLFSGVKSSPHRNPSIGRANV